jgi:hypothetical protein
MFPDFQEDRLLTFSPDTERHPAGRGSYSQGRHSGQVSVNFARCFYAELTDIQGQMMGISVCIRGIGS